MKDGDAMPRQWRTISALSLLFCILFLHGTYKSETAEASAEKTYIKWIDFGVTEAALNDALSADLQSHGSNRPLDWVEILACLASRNGGDFSYYRKAELERIVSLAQSGTAIAEQVKNQKLYRYYLEAYGAVLGGMVGEYTEWIRAADGTLASVPRYGLRAFSPIAEGFGFAHYDDFGASRSYGYRRTHLGHDLMGSVGVPIIAVESGYVEAAGWNQYGGWRIGIRSFDGKRYYYYAHLRRNHPYNDIYEGKIVHAGEVIGYLGMTGYSTKENVNNIDSPHLHYGLQIIFDPSQKDGTNQIWIDLYALTDFLGQNRSPTYSAGGERFATRWYEYPETPD